MIYVIFIIGGLFILLSLPMLYVFYREKHFGTFLMGITYGLSGLLAITLPDWWPLAVGFVMAWMLRLMGMEQRIEPIEKSEDTKDTKDTKEAQINN